MLAALPKNQLAIHLPTLNPVPPLGCQAVGFAARLERFCELAKQAGQVR